MSGLLNVACNYPVVNLARPGFMKKVRSRVWAGNELPLIVTDGRSSCIKYELIPLLMLSKDAQNLMCGGAQRGKRHMEGQRGRGQVQGQKSSRTCQVSVNSTTDRELCL